MPIPEDILKLQKAMDKQSIVEAVAELDLANRRKYIELMEEKELENIKQPVKKVVPFVGGGELAVDSNNVVTIEALGIWLEAIEDKIFVMIDRYRSGYECQNCKETGRVSETVPCVCESRGTPGWTSRFKEHVCPECNGEFEKARKTMESLCPVCKGKRVILDIPDTAKSLPSTGVIMSRGSKCNNPKLTVGTRVLFSPHVGTMIPLKGNIRLKAMREHEPLGIISGSIIGEKSFIDFDIAF